MWHTGGVSLPRFHDTTKGGKGASLALYVLYVQVSMFYQPLFMASMDLCKACESMVHMCGVDEKLTEPLMNVHAGMHAA